MYLFTPNYKIFANVEPHYSIADLEKEQGVYSATPDFVKKHSNCDVRIHRLYPGDYPAYPGWHCDGEYRETYFSQPDLNRSDYSRRSKWFCV